MTDEIPAFDLYAELEVSERASVETIQAAFRSLQLRNHPDRVGLDAGARAVRLNIARDWLTDPQRRMRYNAHLDGVRRPTGGAAGDAVRGGASADDSDHSDARADAHGKAADGAYRDIDDADWPDGADVAFEAEEADNGADVAFEAEEADNEADADGVDDQADADTGRLDALRLHLRLDVGRLVRIWLVGLAFLGALGVTSGIGPAIARVAVAVVALLVLVAISARRMRTDPRDGLVTRVARTGWSILGWLGLALLAAGGVSTIGAASGSAAIGGVVGPTLLATAVVSVFAVRRRDGPVQATIDDFLEMTPREFEIAVGHVLGRHGYRLEVTGGPGDLVADLTGTDPHGIATIVQCKRNAPGRPVGSREVQLLIALGMRHHHAEHLVLVTTSDFTDPARDLAVEHGVTLLNGDELEELTR